MDPISLFEAKNRLSALIDQVSEGQEVTITRRGTPVARLVPVTTQSQQNRKAVEKLRALRLSIAQRGEAFTRDELRAYRDDGRR
jgi:prevent-host-death family protein